ncbi:hypothetical protein IID22_01570 [Patescibacteria group bacterium]|nr:hypothetical protein [Patescibacteria group bacterium]
MNWRFRRRINSFLKTNGLKLVSLRTEELEYLQLGIAKANAQFPLEVPVFAGYEVVTQPPFLELLQPRTVKLRHADEAILERSFGNFTLEQGLNEDQLMEAIESAAELLEN